jgi:hypothetical protein
MVGAEQEYCFRKGAKWVEIMGQPPLIGSRRCVCMVGVLDGTTVLKATMSHGSASQVLSGVTGSLWGREKCVVSGMSVRGVPQALTWG